MTPAGAVSRAAVPEPAFDAGLLDGLLEEAGCRALLILSASSADSAVAPFAGPGRLAPCFVVAPRGDEARLGFLNPMERGEATRSPLRRLGPADLDVARWTRDGAEGAALWVPVLQRAFQHCGLDPGPVALAGSLSAGVVETVCRELAAWGWSFREGEYLCERLRKRKSASVLKHVRDAADGVCEALRVVAGILAEATTDTGGRLHRGAESGAPLTVGDLRAEVAMTFAKRGLTQPEQGILAPGEESALPHSLGTDARVLMAGESLVVDLFPFGHAFADCTRTFCVGVPPEHLARGHARVLEALEIAERLAQPGVRGYDMQVAVCEYFRRHGLPTSVHDRGTERGYVHGLGHGVGVELHELPSFREHASDHEARLETSDIITLEPGLYEPEEGWGVRIEDTYVMTDDGAVSLTPLPRSLDPRDW